MKKSLVLLAVVGLLASVCSAEQVMLKVTCARDNFNLTNAPGQNCGHKCNARWAKGKQETMYCDWEEQDVEEILLMIQTPPPAPFTGWEVRFATTGVGWDAPDPNAIIYFGAFDSGLDWNANESCDNAACANQAGACDSFSDDTAGANIPWTLCDMSPVPSFWQLPELTNSVPFLGFNPSPGPATVDTNQAVVDLAVLQKLAYDPCTRGLRCWSNEYPNFQIYARGQWGCPGPAAPALLVVAVPEPTTMLMIGLGGLGMLIRRKR